MVLNTGCKPNKGIGFSIKKKVEPGERGGGGQPFNGKEKTAILNDPFSIFSINFMKEF